MDKILKSRPYEYGMLAVTIGFTVCMIIGNHFEDKIIHDFNTKSCAAALGAKH